ncbi:MAG TPA: FHA domain-containing protein [Solirubrobacteraceae bacterium]
MVSPGVSRHHMARMLKAAYGDGLLSESTLVHRLDLLLKSRLIDPAGVIGDLTIRAPRRSVSSAVARGLAASRRWLDGLLHSEPRWPTLLALDWSGGQEELLVGRHPGCDVVLGDLTVSRRHARLRFRDGNWVLHDLGSTNGTLVNDARVVRCQLRPGDRVAIGDERLLVD